MIWEQGRIDVIPPKVNRKLSAEFDAKIYRERNEIERFFGKLKSSFHRIITRYEKTSQNFLSMIKLTYVRLWIAFYEAADCWVRTFQQYESDASANAFHISGMQGDGFLDIIEIC